MSTTSKSNGPERIPLIHERFEQTVSAHPNALAIEENHRKFTYRELSERVNLAVRLLEAAGFEGEATVATLLPPGTDLVTTMLACFGSSRIYLPMSHQWPEQKKEEVRKETAYNVLAVYAELDSTTALQVKMGLPVDYTSLVATLGIDPGLLPGYLLVFDDHENIVMLRSRVNGWEEVEPVAPGKMQLRQPGNEDSAYIFYTSGSTGRGKAIVGKQVGVAHFIGWEINHFHVEPGWRLSQVASHTFDASLKDILTALCSGATLCIPPPQVKENFARLAQWLDHRKITMLQTVPSIFRAVLQHLRTFETPPFDFAHLRLVLLAGEPLYGRDIMEGRALLGKAIRFVNLYGLTETSVLKTCYEVPDVPLEMNQVIAVGKSIPQAAVAIIKEGRVCRQGEVGEVYIRSPYLTKGYVFQPELNASLWVQNPLVTDREDMVMRTGDLARYDADKNIEILGRKDDQVKVNGLRIELGAVKKALLTLSGLAQVEVICKTGPDFENKLIAYYTGEKQDPEKIRQAASGVLEQGFVPSFFHWLEEFPLTLSGKVDRKSLPLPGEWSGNSSETEGPQGEAEQKIAHIWKDLLGLEQVGRHVSFFTVGGSSLRAMQLVSRLYKDMYVQLRVADVFAHPTVASMAKVLDMREKQQYESIEKVPLQDDYEVSHSQRRLWVLCEFEGASAAYNMFGAYRLRGLDVPGFKSALDRVMQRHESLRTRIITVKGEPRQKIVPWESLDFKVMEEDLRNANDPVALARMQAAEERSRAFNLGTAPLLRVTLLRIGEQEHVLLFAMHHIVSDGWSMNVLLNEVLVQYDAIRKGNADPLGRLPIQYKDFVAWQNRQLTGEKLREQREYWRSRFQQPVPMLDFPADYPRPAVKTYNGATAGLRLSPELTAVLNNLARTTGSSLFMTLLASVKALLYTYTGQCDIVVGSPIAGREHFDLEDQIGFFANTLALRTVFTPDMPFSALLAEVRETMLGAYKHQHFPFDELVDTIGAARDTSRSPLFDVLVALQTHEFLTPEVRGMEGVEVEGLASENRVSQFDLSFYFTELEHEIVLNLEYNTSLFKPERMKLLLAHLQKLMHLCASDPNLCLADLYLPDANEETRLKVSGPPIAVSTTETVVGAITRQAAAQPRKTALQTDTETLTYAQLLERVEHLAFTLQGRGVAPGDCVAVMCDRSQWLPISMLAIWKIGAVYLPLDPEHPASRLEHIFRETDPRLVLLTKTHQATGTLPALILSGDVMTMAAGESNQVNAAADQAAYIMYTSGSTGKPKGVAVSHGALANFLRSMQEQPGFQASDKLLAVTTAAFDISLLELLLPLYTGGTLRLAGSDEVRDPRTLVSLLHEEDITMFQSTPSRLNLLLDSGWKILPDLKIISGGEPLDHALAQKLCTMAAEVWNAYGPTETTVWSSIKKLEPTQPVTAGKPIANTRVYVLDERMKPAVTGVWGEVYIAGEGVALGYVKNETQTAERFLNDPFVAGERMYRTGDRGRWNLEGDLELSGRLDDQLKWNGYRIEPGEINAALRSIDGVHQSAVVLSHGETAPGLTAFVVGEGIDMEQLSDRLAAQLPAYMIPRHFLQLDELPRNTSGKLDKPKLEQLAMESTFSNRHAAIATSGLETRLAAIWKELLPGVPVVGRNDDFFALGGNSLLAMRVLSRIWERERAQVRLQDFFRNPTVPGLANCIETLHREPETITPLPQATSYRLSPLQERFWIMYKLHPEDAVFWIPAALKVGRPVEETMLRKSLEYVLNRHESLRAAFSEKEGQLRQYTQPAGRMEVPLTVLQESEGKDPSELLAEAARGMLTKGLDMEHGPLWHVLMLHTRSGTTRFLYVMHHIISDDWSIEVLINEVNTVYRQLEEGQAPALPALPFQYRDFAEWHARLLKGAHAEQMRKFWMEHLRGAPSGVAVPLDHPRPATPSARGEEASMNFGPELLERLKHMQAALGVTFYHQMIAATTLYLARISGQADVVIGTPASGRDLPGLAEQVGLFVNMLPLRFGLDEERSFEMWVAHVREVMSGAIENQYYPFERIVHDQGLARDPSRHPLYNVVVRADQPRIANAAAGQKDQVDHSAALNVFSGSKVDLRFLYRETPRGLTLSVLFDSSLFERESVELHMLRIQKLLGQLVDEPGVALRAITIATDPGKQEMRTEDYQFNF